jgi:hypothetical protein
VLFGRQEEEARAERDSEPIETRRKRGTNTGTSRKRIKLIPARDEIDCRLYIVFSFYTALLLYFAYLVLSPQPVPMSNVIMGRCVARIPGMKGKEVEWTGISADVRS